MKNLSTTKVVINSRLKMFNFAPRKDNLEKGNNKLRITNAGLKQKNDDVAREIIGLKNKHMSYMNVI